jgi:phosphatidylglycerol:prolipoprotein diacylglycerol transferase
VALRAPKEDALPLVEAGMWGLLTALMGGRAAYAWLAWPAFEAHPQQILQVSLGGLVWPGALAGALVILPALAHFTRRSPLALADALLPLLASVTVAAWLGCIPAGYGYGPPATWGGMTVPDEWGALARRWPVQTVCALGCLALFWVTDQIPARASATQGLRACLMLFGLAVIQLGAAALTPPDRLWRGLPLDAWAALALALLALVGLGIAVVLGKRREIE